MKSLFRVSCYFVCATLAACGYFIPPDKSAPRYNTLIGEPRRPELNPSSGRAAPNPDSGAMVTSPNNMPTTMRQDVAMNDVAPPSAMQQAPMQQIQAPVEAPMILARHVPDENPNTGYPSLNSVPPSSTIDKDAADRLARVRAELEQERAQAAAQKDQLSRDAAAESPATNGNNSNAAPLPEPVAVQPIAPPTYTPPPVYTQPPAYTPPPAPAPAMIPSPTRIPSSNMAPMQNYAPITYNAPVAPAPMMQVANNASMSQPMMPMQAALPPPPAPMISSGDTDGVPAPVAVAPMSLGAIPAKPALPPMSAPVISYTPPAQTAAQEPILLRPPSSGPTSSASAAYTPQLASSRNTPSSSNNTAQPMTPAGSGGFNPLEGSAPAYSTYNSSGYLASSRYAPTRAY